MSTATDPTEEQACHSGPHGYIQDKPRYLNRLMGLPGLARKSLTVDQAASA